jgi:subtilisin family serine protease
MNTNGRYGMDSRRPVSLLPKAFLAIFLAIALPAASSAAGRLSKDLQSVQPGESLDVIVQFKNSPSAADLSAIRQQGGILKRAFGNIRGAVFTVTGSILGTVAQNANVTYISPDRKLAGKLEFAEPTVGANIAFQNGWTGAGVAVAVIDSGIQGDHPDLKGRVTYSENFAPGDSMRPISMATGRKWPALWEEMEPLPPATPITTRSVESHPRSHW